MKIEMTEWLLLGISSLIVGLILAVEHWFPYTKPLTLIQKYIAGVLALWTGFALWRLLCNDWVTPIGLGIICGVGGSVVLGSYYLDDHKRRVRQAQNAERQDAELQG